MGGFLSALQLRVWFISFIFQNPGLLHNFLACEVALMASSLQINSFIEVSGVHLGVWVPRPGASGSFGVS